MSAEENKLISNRILEAMGVGDFDTLKELMSPTMYEDFVKSFSEVRASFPDYHGSNIDTIAEGDKVAQRFVCYGTHLGSFMGIAPTGKQITIKGMSFDQYSDGKLIANWVEVDMVGILQQLGVNLP